MKIPHAALPAARTLVLLIFAGCCAWALGYLWLNSGGRLPLLSQTGYRVSVALPDIDNLVTESDVKQAGVDIGRVVDTQVTGDRALVTVQLDNASAPLHQGATITVRNKTLIEETYLDIADGSGPVLAPGTTLPPNAGHRSVQFDDVLASLDPPTRQSLGSLLRSSGVATAQRRDDIAGALSGLGAVGRQGTDGLTALADQSDDLRRLTVNTAALLGALDTQHGHIADLVTDSERIFRATAQGHTDLEAFLRRLPPLLGTARDASGSLTTLAQRLHPVAANLRDAGPEVSSALRQLPDTSHDLRATLSPLEETLRLAPDTLDRVPELSDNLRALFPPLGHDLTDVNPAVAFLAPYSRDLAAFFTNFSASVGPDDGNAKIFRILFLFNEQSVNLPINTNIGPLEKRNSIPEPGTGAKPNPHGDSQQSYPRVEPDPGPR